MFIVLDAQKYLLLLECLAFIPTSVIKSDGLGLENYFLDLDCVVFKGTVYDDVEMLSSIVSFDLIMPLPHPNPSSFHSLFL
jgi:hypothetical protein